MALARPHHIHHGPGFLVRERAQAAGYVLLTVLVFIATATLAASAQVTVFETAAQREKEAQLLFVGMQYRNAISAYYHSAPPGSARSLPPTLEALVNDTRFGPPRHHLREIYPDPITRSADWVLVYDGTGIVGVHSRSMRKPIKQQGFPAPLAAFASKKHYSDWNFSVQ